MSTTRAGSGTGRVGCAGSGSTVISLAETACRPGAREPLRRHQVADEDEGLARRDRPASPAVAVGQVRRNDQLPPPADAHALHALVPARDDLPRAKPELKRVATAPARVELLACRVSDADVMDADGVAGLRFGAVAFPDLGDLEVGRRLAAGKVDLRLLAAHARLSGLGSSKRRAAPLAPLLGIPAGQGYAQRVG